MVNPNEPAIPTLAPANLHDELPEGKLEDGLALCLSGGGYRAMIFHIGAYWRLNEAGLLPELSRISSVSGGSITSAFLGFKWAKLGFGPDKVASRFVDEFVSPLRALSRETIDVKSVLSGILWFGTIGDKIAAAYRKFLFGNATLQDLPDVPRFVLNATNVQSGSLFRFSKPYLADYQIGQVMNPQTELAIAVGASSAFPPVLSPVILKIDPSQVQATNGEPLNRTPFNERVVLSDGGVYDNLGLETIIKRYRTLLVSDAGGHIQPEEVPHEDWARHSMRVLDVIDNQVRSLRKRQLLDTFKAGSRAGTYWGIRTNIADYQLPDALPCPHARTMALASQPTRLAAMSEEIQERLINWGYAVCDAALRKHARPATAKPKGLPYPNRAV